ncbi:hypothetical protein BDZ94DRAFT_1271503 [Collybia nuda]|uniref:Uncharacterized protein n=1 Tax=Collybia nuda TaxID=64659 RepID=A0A9P5XWM0_9AGAR|nr:hypothetical protein BDZ94DRAFT_1271503 [Collybia nuda]
MSSTPFQSSTTSLISKKTSPKNYEAAFGNLVSSFGFGGGVPTVPRKATQTTQPRKSQAPSPQTSSHPTQKNYEAAFGSLSSSYGFGSGAVVAVPTLPRSKP